MRIEKSSLVAPLVTLLDGSHHPSTNSANGNVFTLTDLLQPISGKSLEHGNSQQQLISLTSSSNTQNATMRTKNANFPQQSQSRAILSAHKQLQNLNNNNLASPPPMMTSSVGTTFTSKSFLDSSITVMAEVNGAGNHVLPPVGTILSSNNNGANNGHQLLQHQLSSEDVYTGLGFAGNPLLHESTDFSFGTLPLLFA